MQSTPLIAFDQHAATTVAAVLLPGQRTPALHRLASDSPTILRFVRRLQRQGPVDVVQLVLGLPQFRLDGGGLRAAGGIAAGQCTRQFAVEVTQSQQHVLSPAHPLRKFVVASRHACRHLVDGCRGVAGAVAAYALSPIDLIPDFIPILGYLDDLIILPLGIMLAVKLVPPALMAEFRAKADRRQRPTTHAGLIFIVLVWAAVAVFLAWLFWPQAAIPKARS